MSRPRDVYAIENDMHIEDSVMDTVVTSALQKPCLSQSSISSDHTIGKAENEKFRNNFKSSGLVLNNVTKRFIPLAMNRLGLRVGTSTHPFKNVPRSWL